MRSGFITILLLFCLAAASADMTYSPSGLTMSNSLRNLLVANGRLYAYGDSVRAAGSDPKRALYHARVHVFDGSEWEMLPDRTDKGEYLLIGEQGQVQADSSGNLYMSGKHMYRFDGKEWIAFHNEDEHSEHRRYHNFCVDAKGDLWITSSVAIFSGPAPAFEKSELFRYSGGEFERIMETPSMLSFTGISSQHFSYLAMSGIAATRDEKVVLHRVFQKYLEDNETDLLKNIFVIDINDNSMDTLRLPVTGDAKVDSSNKNISHIYIDAGGTIWFASDTKDIYPYYPEDMTSYPCCGGLASLDGAHGWRLFGEKEGLPPYGTHGFGSYPVGHIAEDEGTLYFTAAGPGKSYFGRMSHDNQGMTLTDMSQLLQDALFIPRDGQIDEQMARSILENFDMSSSTGGIAWYGNKLWIAEQRGLIAIDKSVAGVGSSEEEAIIFPTIVTDMLNVGSPGFEEFAIYGLMGNAVASGFLSGNVIDTSLLSRGVYFVRLRDASRIAVAKFVKE